MLEGEPTTDSNQTSFFIAIKQIQLWVRPQEFLQGKNTIIRIACLGRIAHLNLSTEAQVQRMSPTTYPEIAFLWDKRVTGNDVAELGSPLLNMCSGSAR